jgi:hypothetical protein
VAACCLVIQLGATQPIDKKLFMLAVNVEGLLSKSFNPEFAIRSSSGQANYFFHPG